MAPNTTWKAYKACYTESTHLTEARFGRTDLPSLATKPSVRSQFSFIFEGSKTASEIIINCLTFYIHSEKYGQGGQSTVFLLL